LYYKDLLGGAHYSTAADTSSFDVGGDEGNIKVSKTKMSSFMAACVHVMSNTNFYFQIHLVRSKKYTTLLRMI